MTAATAQRLVDSNQKQSFPLSSHPSPHSAFPSLPVLCKTDRHKRFHSRYSVRPRESRGFPSVSRAPYPGVSPHPGSPPRLHRIPNLSGTRSQEPRAKALTREPNFRLATGMGRGKRRSWGRARRVHISSQLFAPAAIPILVSKPAAHSSSLPNTKAHSCHEHVAGEAPRLSQNPGRRLTFPSPCIVERAPRPRAAGGPRHPPDSPSAPIQLCSCLEGLLRIAKADRQCLRPHVHVPRRPLIPLVGN